MFASRPRRVVVVGMVLAALPFLVGAGNGNGGVSDAARAEHQRIVDFWTPERVARAVPRDFFLDLESGKFLPAKRPAPPSGDTAIVSGSSWTKGGAIDGASGKVLFAMGTSYYVCSATVLDDPDHNGRSLILTAAHCVFDESTGNFATNWMFIPDYDAAPAPLTTNGSFCSSTLYGCWTPVAMVVHDGYASAGGFNDQAVLYDFAVVAVGPGGHDITELETEVIEQTYSFTTIASDGSVTGYAFGYPAQGKWKGNDLIYCKGPITTDPLNADLTYRLAGCKLSGGSSGGPWLIGFSETTGSGTVISLNSYGYSGVTAMHGPMLNADTESVYSAALSTKEKTLIVP